MPSLLAAGGANDRSSQEMLLPSRVLLPAIPFGRALERDILPALKSRTPQAPAPPARTAAEQPPSPHPDPSRLQYHRQ